MDNATLAAAASSASQQLDRQAVNNLLDELRRQKYDDIKNAKAPPVFDYKDYNQYLLDKNFYENKLLANSHLFYDDPAKLKEIQAILQERETERRRENRSHLIKILFYIFFMGFIFYLGFKN